MLELHFGLDARRRLTRGEGDLLAQTQVSGRGV